MRRRVVYSAAAQELADYLASDAYQASVARARAERSALEPPAKGWIDYEKARTLIRSHDQEIIGRVNPHG